MKEELYEKILNSHFDLVYVLDDKGNYIFANDAYLAMLKMTKEEILGYNVHNFLKNGTIDVCVSDKVYKEKKQIIMFQDIYLGDLKKDPPMRHIIISTPILDEYGNVTNIFAIMKSVDKLNDAYHKASIQEVSSIALSQMIDSPENDIIADSPAMKELLEIANTVSDVDSAVLIQGESGTGKEVIANYIHKTSSRATNKFVTINCASLPENLLESELFGYEKGSFTGATSPKVGLFQEADKGTLFLDEINSLPIGLQGKLLRALETKKIQRIGSTKQIPVDFRLIVATNEDLHHLVNERLFRADLYYRLNVIPLNIPPLRDRPEDIIPLSLFFLKNNCQRFKRNVSFTSSTFQALLDYSWPGNVRELKNYIERLVILSSSDYIDIKEINTHSISGYFEDDSLFEESLEHVNNPAEEISFEKMLNENISLDQYLEECEKKYLEYALKEYNSSYKVAEMLKTSQSSIIRKKKKYNL